MATPQVLVFILHRMKFTKNDGIKMVLGLALAAVVSGCYVEGGGPVVVGGGPVFWGGPYYERGPEVHVYSHRGFESRAVVHGSVHIGGGRRW